MSSNMAPSQPPKEAGIEGKREKHAGAERQIDKVEHGGDSDD